MVDTALSVSSSVLATLLATGSTDQPAAGSTAAKPADPFAALLANVTDGKPGVGVASRTDTLHAADPMAALLAGTAAISAPPAGTPPSKIAPIVASQPLAETASPVVPSDPAGKAPVQTKAKNGDDADDGESEPGDQGKDPLADAIASGATAVLALAPTIVAAPAPAPVAAEPATPRPIRIDTPAAPVARARLATIPRQDEPVAPLPVASDLNPVLVPSANGSARPDGAQPKAVQSDFIPPEPVRSEAVHPAVVQREITQLKIAQPDAAQPDPGAPEPAEADTVRPLRQESQPAEAPVTVTFVERLKPTPQPDPSQDVTSAAQPQPASPDPDPAAPAPVRSEGNSPGPQPSTAVSTDIVRLADAAAAGITPLPQDDTAAPKQTPSAPIATTAPPPDAQPTAQPVTASPGRGETPPVQAPARRRSVEASAPRRTGDARRRADVATTESNIGIAGPRPAEAGAASQPAAIAGAQPKGDAIIQQTLTIGRDGAWLDKLARDIANTSNGGDLQFKLDPQHLGSLTVAIAQTADGASIRLTADNDTARNLLLDAQPKLLAEARAQGLKVSETHVDLNQNQAQNQNQGQNQQGRHDQPQAHVQTASQDLSRWAQGGSGQNGAQNGQNRQSSPGHQPFVSNLRRKAEAESESSQGDSGALYA
jgi:flagellar hook-length control protein FliK